MLQAVPALDVLVVPVGGGGLIAGIATAARALNPRIKIYGVESRTYPSMHQRLKGEPIKVGGDTIAEGIAVKDVGDLAFAIIQKQVEEVLVVEEETIERGIVALIEIEKTVAEGAGAAALAALLEHPQRFAGKRVGIPISGGNIDSRVLASVLMRGLVRDARLVRLRVTMPDVSGSLAKVAQLIADAGGNIVEVQHQRIFGTAASTPEPWCTRSRKRASGFRFLEARLGRGPSGELECGPQRRDCAEHARPHIQRGYGPLPALDQGYGFDTEGGKGGESSEEAGEQQQADFRGKERVALTETGEDASDQATEHVHGERAVGKLCAHGVMQNERAELVSQHRARGAAQCHQQDRAHSQLS